MFLPSLISAGALALSVDAFLVPFGSNNVQADDFSIYEGPHEVSVDCVSCPFGLPSSQDGQVEWKQGVPSDLDMLFNVEKNLVTFNGVAVYPLPNPSLVPLLTVTQRPKNGIEGANEEVPHDLKLSYSLEVIPRPAQDGNTLLTLTLGPMALENEMIRVDDVEVQIIRDANGKLIIHSVKTVTPGPNSPDAQCKNVFCRVFTRFVASVAKAKAATKAGIQKAKGHCSRCLRCMLRLIGIKSKHHSHANHGSGVPHRGPDGTVELPTHIKTRPGFHDGHPHLQPVDINVAPERGFFGRAIHVMWVAFKIALIPILIGIAFGMTASAIGMLVGQLVVLLWMRHRRQAEAPVYERLDLDFKEEIPPPYEDAPSTNVEVVNEKEVEDKA